MKQEILRLLIESRGKFISGEEISRRMSVSRTAIWKQINNLKDEGYVIESVHRQGYRLLEYPDTINKEELKLRLGTEIFGRAVHVYEEVSSTNDFAKKLAAEGAPEGTIVIAERQLQGKGRMGRAWVSPAQKGIWFTFVLRPRLLPSLATQLIFVSAVGVCRALRKFTGLDVTIKWPNDLVISGKKVCGILTELSAEIDMINYVVVGVGINSNHKEDDFPDDIKEKAVSLAIAAGRNFRRTDLLVEILRELEDEYKNYLKYGFDEVIARWKELNSTLGQEVMVSSGEERYNGIARNINDDGCLLVERTDGTLSVVMVGDVSVRGTEGSYI